MNRRLFLSLLAGLPILRHNKDLPIKSDPPLVLNGSHSVTLVDSLPQATYYERLVFDPQTKWTKWPEAQTVYVTGKAQ